MMGILELDRLLTLSLNGSHSLYIDGLAYTATQTVTWLPLVLVLLYITIKDNDLNGVCRLVIGVVLCIIFADQMASSVFKPLVARWRPTNDPFIMYTVDVVKGYRGGSYGFFSSHAANTMAVATFLTLIARNKILSIWLYSWALINCWTRVYLGVHYVGDLTVGTIWGIAVGFGVYYLIIRSKYRPKYTMTQAQSVIGTSSAHLFIICLLTTYMYIAIRALFFVG